jgi:hypothetical protein
VFCTFRDHFQTLSHTSKKRVRLHTPRFSRKYHGCGFEALKCPNPLNWLKPTTESMRTTPERPVISNPGGYHDGLVILAGFQQTLISTLSCTHRIRHPTLCKYCTVHLLIMQMIIMYNSPTVWALGGTHHAIYNYTVSFILYICHNVLKLGRSR